MSKVVEFLNANPVQYLATVGRDGKATTPVTVSQMLNIRAFI